MIKKILLSIIVVLLLPMTVMAWDNKKAPCPPTPHNDNYHHGHYYNRGRTIYDYYPALVVPPSTFGYYTPFSYPYPYYSYSYNPYNPRYGGFYFYYRW